MLVILLPIVTTPYISRVLEVDGIGRYSVSVAIANYFVLFGMLGISSYGNRQVAYVRNNEENLRKTFWEINVLRMITMGISFISFSLFVHFTIPQYNRVLYYMQLLTLAASFVDISWFYVGMEEFQKTATRNILVKIISVMLIFLLVKSKEDISLYALIISSSTLIGQIFLWMTLPKSIRQFKQVQSKILVHHLGNTIQLWLPSIAINVYSSLDKVMLGYLTDDIQVGLYENSQKIVKIAATITTSLSTVLVPRMANLYKNDDMEEFERLAEKSFGFISFIAIPICFGIIGIRDTLIPWFFGVGYQGISNLLLIGSWLVVTLGWSSIFGLQILVSCHQEKKYTIAVTVGAIVNIVLNLFLITRLKAGGVLLASVVAEYTGMFIMMFYSRKFLNIRKILKILPKYFIAGFFMYLIIYYVGSLIETPVFATIVQIPLGMFIYIFLMIFYRDDNIKFAISIIKRKLLKK